MAGREIPVDRTALRQRPGHRAATFNRMADATTLAAMSELDATATQTAAVVEVELDGTRHHLAWPRDRSLVDTMLDAGIDVPHSCREGHCGSCVATVVAGRVEMAVCDILEPADLEDGLILTCQARPVSDDVQIEF